MNKKVETAPDMNKSLKHGKPPADSLDPVLVFDDVTMAFGPRTILSGFNLTLGPKEVIGVHGPSGAGKSTLLKMAAGLISPVKGRVRLAHGPIGYVFQEPRLIPWYTALENICLAVTAWGHTMADARKTALRLLSDMGLESFENHYPRQLSGGMNQRVSIARALAVNPILLLLDEPFTGLDPALKSQVREKLSQMVADQGISVIHVTHDTGELLPATCKRICPGSGAGLQHG